MHAPSFSRNQATCKVCYDAGNFQNCRDHTTKGGVCPPATLAVIQGGWPLSPSSRLDQVTLCPVLQQTVCTNPQCFNGQNGQIRFPCFGHSISHCPCQWPQGWNIGEPLEHMRYTGYTPQQWRQMEHQQMQDLHRQMLLLDFPPPGPLVRSVATVVPMDQEEYPKPPKLVRQNAGDGTEVEWSSSDEENQEESVQENLPEPLEVTDKETQLRKEIQELREKLHKKQQAKKEKKSWADLMDSDEENDSDDELAKVAPEEEEEEGIGCNNCYPCVTGGAGPCVKELSWNLVKQNGKKSRGRKTRIEKKKNQGQNTQQENRFLLLAPTSE